MVKLEISLFGQFQVLLNGIPVTQFESVKVRALLAYLSAEYARAHTRESLATLLWPDWPQQSAMRNLRNALADLRQNIGDREAQPPFLLVTRDSLQLNRAADLQVDVVEFETATRNLPFAISLYRGPFLDGFPQTDSPPFEEWVLGKREYLSQQVLKALGRLAEESLEQGEYEQAEGYARRQIELEPWREPAYQQLMRALSMRGERVQALAQFENLRKALQRELKVEPSEDMAALYQQIRDGELQGRREQKPGIREQPLGTEDLQSPITNLKSKIYNHQSKILHNLPLQLTSFIGREKEIDAIKRLLQSNRLVTLTGPGGTGKTRLSLQTAAGLLGQYADGVWLVELAPVVDPTMVPMMAARALGLRELPGSKMVTLLQEYLEPRQVLLILDNCEHVIEACIFLSEALLQTCPKLTILVSSREALGIPGEVPFRVPPLSLPPAMPPYGAAQVPPPTLASPPIEELAQYEAIRLFVERATTVSQGFNLTDANASTILQVCQRLDGIPLAIELAAARVKLLGMEEITQRLNDRFRLLTGGSRAALPRYQTLRACIDWSYELLSPSERALLQRLSVFAGGWVLEAAETVGCGEDIQACDVLDLLGLLVDKSLIQTSNEVAGLYRFRMLETIRQYAHEKLVETGQAEKVRGRHLQYYLELAEKARWALRGPEQPRWLSTLGNELDNLRLALSWSLESKGQPGWDPEPGLRLASALWWFWHPRGQHLVGIQWIEQLLSAEEEDRGQNPLSPSRCQSRAEALLVASSYAAFMGEHRLAKKYSEECLTLFSTLGKAGRKGVASTLYYQGGIASHQGDLLQATRLMNESRAIAHHEGDRFTEAEVLMTMGMDSLNHHDFEQAKTFFNDNLTLRKEMGDRDGEAGTLFQLGRLAFEQGYDQQARALFLESQGIFFDIGNQYAVTLPIPLLGRLEWIQGKYERAANFFNETLSTGRRQGDISSTFIGLLSLGRLALSRGDFTLARTMFTEGLGLSQKNDCQLFISLSFYFLGILAWVEENSREATQWFNQAMENSKRNQEPFSEILTWLGLYRTALAEQDYDQARRSFAELINAWQSRITASAPWNIPVYLEPYVYLEEYSYLAIAEKRIELAARLLGATQAYHQRFHLERTLKERAMREKGIATLRAALGEEVFEQAWEEGRRLSLEQALKEVAPS